MCDVRPFAADIFLDSSLTRLRSAFNNFVYALSLPKNYNSYNIAQFEIFNIVVARPGKIREVEYTVITNPWLILLIQVGLEMLF